MRGPTVCRYVSSMIRSAAAQEDPVAFQSDTVARSALGSGSAKASDGRGGYLRMRKSALLESSLCIKRGPSQNVTEWRSIRRWSVRGVFSVSVGCISCDNVPQRERSSGVRNKCSKR